MFKKGMKVRKTIYWHGKPIGEPPTDGVVTKVAKGVAYFNDEWGITFDAETGKEVEGFFPGFTSEITPLENEEVATFEDKESG
jgi:hypothetical protein